MNLLNNSGCMIYGNEFDKYLHFLELLFDNVFFIFNTKNIEEVRKSKWWGLWTVQQILNIIKQNYITYDDVINKTPKLKDLYNKNGLEYNETIINETLNTRYAE